MNVSHVLISMLNLNTSRLFWGTMSNTQRWILSYTSLNSPCCNLSSVHRCWSLMRVVGVLDQIPADRRQENTKTGHRPTHTVCSYTPNYESTLNRWTDFWWKPEKLLQTQNGKNGHTHGNGAGCLATPVCIRQHTSVSQRGGPWRFNSKYSPACHIHN